MALFGNDMFGHHMVSGSHGQSQGFGKGNTGASFGTGNASFGQHGGQNHAQGHLGHHAIFGRQKSLLNDMTSSKGDKSKPFVFSSYSYPYDYHHDGMASMFEKPLEEKKKKDLVRPDKPEFRRAPSFSSNPKLMRSKTINQVDSPPSTRKKLSKSLSVSEDITIPLNSDLKFHDFSRRNSEKPRRHSTTDGNVQLPKKTTWPDIVRRFSRKKKASKEKAKKSTASTDDSARESMGSTSSIGATESPRSSAHDLPSDERPRCDTIDSKFSRQSIKSRSSTSSDYDREQERIILSLLSDKQPEYTEVFDDTVVSSTNSHSLGHHISSSTYDSGNPWFDQRIEDESDVDDEDQMNYSESPTLVLRRIKHLHASETDDTSVKSGNSGRTTPRSYFSDRSEPSSTYKQNNVQEPLKKQEKKNGHVMTYIDPKPSENSSNYFDFPKNTNPKRSEKSQEPQVSAPKTEDKSTKPSIPQRASVQDIVNNFRNLHACPIKAEKPTPNETYKPEPVRKPYVEPKVFTISPPAPRPATSIFSKPVIPGYKKEPVAENQAMVQHVKPSSRDKTPERVLPKYTNSFKPEPEVKDVAGNGNLTADSSESGYGTSHIANSPKGYDNTKVLNFVNSLPNYSDMEEHHSETSNEMVMNGSETESIGDDDSEIFEPQSDLSKVECASGSDTETASINSDISESKLEVTKLLESPTAVCERVQSEMSRHSNQSSPSVIYRKMSEPNVTKSAAESDKVFTYNIVTHNADPSDNIDKTEPITLKKDRSETELLRPFESDKKPDPEKDTKVSQEANVEVTVSKPESMQPMAESKLYRGPDQNDHPSLGKTSRAFSYASSRPYSIVQDSNLMQCLDAVLHLLNCLLVLCSVGVIGAGMWLLMKDFNVNHVTIILGDNLLQVIVYISIAGAGIAILAALCLCCGVKKDKHGLTFFAIVLIIVIIAFSTAAILSAIFADKLRGIEFRVNFKERLISKYGNVSSTDQENEYFTASWDSMQKLFECCGAEGQESDMSSWAVFKKFSIWYRKQPLKATIYVPESCCKKDMNQAVCQGSDHNLLGPPVYGPPVDDIYSQKNPNLNTTGCYDLFASYLAKVATWVAIIMGGLAGLYFVIVMLTWVFCYKKNQDYEDYLYGSFYEMEHDDQNVFHPEQEIEIKHIRTDEPIKMQYESEYQLNSDGGKVSEPFNQPPIEETSFITQSVEITRQVPNKTSNIEDQIIPHGVKQTYTPNEHSRHTEPSRPAESKSKETNRPAEFRPYIYDVETNKPAEQRNLELHRTTEQNRPSQWHRTTEVYRPNESYRPTELYRPSDSHRTTEPNNPSYLQRTTEQSRPSDSHRTTEQSRPNGSYRPTEHYRHSEPNRPVSSLPLESNRPKDSYIPAEPRSTITYRPIEPYNNKYSEFERPNNQGVTHENSDSETDSDTDSESKTFRRNLWLSSDAPGKAVNLLSITIEEEDSNFEDSDVEDSNVQGVKTYTRH